MVPRIMINFKLCEITALYDDLVDTNKRNKLKISWDLGSQSNMQWQQVNQLLNGSPPKGVWHKVNKQLRNK